MSKPLLIVESPAKAKTISKYLDNQFEVVASVGHIRDLPKSNKNAIDIAAGYVPHYEVSPGKEKVVADLKRRARQAPEVVLATDPDREGEAIAWHIQQLCDLEKPKRIVFNEITREAVQEALRHPRSIDQHLRQAQEARRVLDRLFGYDLSGLIWQKVRYGLSAGRVQSPALRILVEREKEIRAFVPEKFWVIEAQVTTAQKASFTLTCSEEPDTQQRADEIVTLAQKSTWNVTDVAETQGLRRPRPPFITSTLQQAASTRLNFSPSRTMKLAQSLYEAGHITYMRTDSPALSQQAQAAISQEIIGHYGKEYYQPVNYKSRSKNAQEAHEAIRPTHIDVRAVGKNQDEKKLYDLIWRRTIASQMADARLLKTTITAKTSQSAVPAFTATGARIVFEGWLKADPAARGEEIELPQVQSNDPLTLESIAATGKETQPPHRFSEAGLIKELEKRGIGRPSTYASIIQTIISRGYVEKIQRSLKPTDVGELVSDFLQNHFETYISDSFTADMENKLDDIADGQQEYAETLDAFYKEFAAAVKSKKDIPKITTLGPAPADMLCPLCQGVMVIKLSKTGKFYSCARFPSCTGARTLDGTLLEGPKETGELCPDCGGKLVERDGRYGRFTACGNYPKCKYIKKDTGENGNQAHTGVACPMCKIGFMGEKRGRYGVFYGCTNYPKCTYIIKAKPTGAICGYAREQGPCPHLMMEGTKTIPNRCADKTCPNHNPHKLS